jgi:sugar phosphate isomerase/epimerase
VRLGLSSYAYTWAVGVPGYPPERPLTAVQLIEEAARLGVQVVQLADNLPLHLMPAARVEALAARAARLGLQIEVGTRGIAPAHLREYLTLARRFGSPILRVVIGGDDPPEVATELLRTQRRDFEQAGVMLAIENHDRLPAATLARMVTALGPHWCGVCLDTANSLGALEGTAAVVETLGPWTVNVHVKDIVITRVPHLMGFTVEGRPAGHGQLDLSWLLGELAGRRAGLSAVLELWTPPEPALEATIRKERSWVEQSIGFLAPLVSSLP